MTKDSDCNVDYSFVLTTVTLMVYIKLQWPNVAVLYETNGYLI